MKPEKEKEGEFFKYFYRSSEAGNFVTKTTTPNKVVEPKIKK